KVEQGLLFVALVLVLLAQAQDLPEDSHIEALSLGLCEDFLLALCLSCVLPLQEAHTYAAKVTDGLTHVGFRRRRRTRREECSACCPCSRARPGFSSIPCPS